MKFKINHNGNEHQIEAIRQGDRLRVVVDDHTPIELTVAQQKDGITTLQQDNQLIHAALHRNGSQRQLWINGRTLTYERVEARQAAQETGGGSLSASIPAVVTDILVEVGDEVEAGAKLILLESMKMVIPIQAPADGVVTAIHCSAGEAVQPNVPLIALD